MRITVNTTKKLKEMYSGIPYEDEKYIRQWVVSQPVYKSATPEQIDVLNGVYVEAWRYEIEENDPDANIVDYFKDIEDSGDYTELETLHTRKGYESPKVDPEVEKHVDRLSKEMNKYGAKDFKQLDTLQQFSLNEVRRLQKLAGLLKENSLLL